MPFSSMPDLPDWLQRIVSGVGASLPAALIGRLMWHSTLVRQGKRKFLSWELVWEIPVVLGMGMIGRGVAEYLGVVGFVADSVIAILAYMGPRGIESLFHRWIDKTAAGPGPKETK